MTLTHCLAPYDQGSESLQGDSMQLESGGFQIITDGAPSPQAGRAIVYCRSPPTHGAPSFRGRR